MNSENVSHKITTGDWVGSAWNSSPRWTPYAQAIANHYPIQIPLFYTITIILSNTPADLSIPRVVLTDPYLYDVLIMGMSARQVDPISLVGQTYLNITHVETGIPWVAPNTIGFSPLPAFAGMTTIGSAGAPTMTNMKLPEAFFLPAHTQLKFEWLPIRLDVTPPVTVQLTMLGVQLINHKSGFKTPERVRMPDGEDVPVGSRQPWFATIPFGSRPNVAASRAFFDYELAALTQAVSYAPPSDCDVEIHDAYASFLDSAIEAGETDGLVTKLDDARTRNDWTPHFIPVGSIFGSLIEIDPCMPFPKPQILPTDHKLLMVAQSNVSGIAVEDGTVTFRGVRRCKY